jgi:hypothetical protein
MIAPPNLHPPPGGHEERDVSLRPIVLAGLTLAVTLLLFGAGTWLLLRHYAGREARRSPPPNPIAASLGEPVPPEPRLQDRPVLDLRQLRAEEDAQLNGYAWVDRSAGRVRIPIEQAMELVVARGLHAERR